MQRQQYPSEHEAGTAFPQEPILSAGHRYPIIGTIHFTFDAKALLASYATLAPLVPNRLWSLEPSHSTAGDSKSVMLTSSSRHRCLGGVLLPADRKWVREGADGKAWDEEFGGARGVHSGVRQALPVFIAVPSCNPHALS